MCTGERQELTGVLSSFGLNFTFFSLIFFFYTIFFFLAIFDHYCFFETSKTEQPIRRLLWINWLSNQKTKMYTNLAWRKQIWHGLYKFGVVSKYLAWLQKVAVKFGVATQNNMTMCLKPQCTGEASYLTLTFGIYQWEGQSSNVVHIVSMCFSSFAQLIKIRGRRCVLWSTLHISFWKKWLNNCCFVNSFSVKRSEDFFSGNMWRFEKIKLSFFRIYFASNLRDQASWLFCIVYYPFLKLRSDYFSP